GNRFEGGYYTKNITLSGRRTEINSVRCQHIHLTSSSSDCRVDMLQVNSWNDPTLTGGITDEGQRNEITKIYDFLQGRTYKPDGNGINRYVRATGSIFIIPEKEEEFYDFYITDERNAIIYNRTNINVGTILHFKNSGTGRIKVYGRPGVMIN